MSTLELPLPMEDDKDWFLSPLFSTVSAEHLKKLQSRDSKNKLDDYVEPSNLKRLKNNQFAKTPELK
jgi:hypothetical protein